MFEILKIRVLRWLIRIAVKIKWRGKVDATIHTESINVGSREKPIFARTYKPKDASGPLPVILFFHGGGWVGFDVDTHDPLCRDLCRHTGHMIISVDYRLAPEHPFPAGVNDCLEALDWLIANVEKLGGNANQILICGDSAGGNLAAVVALQARTRHPGKLTGQILIYPVTDHISTEWPSYTTYGSKEYPLTHVAIEEIWGWYVKGSKEWKAGQTSHDLATPYRVKDISGLPRTLVVIANEDLLRDEGIAYADRMKEAGVDVKMTVYPGQKHGFVGTEPTPAHYQAISEIAQWVSRK